MSAREDPMVARCLALDVNALLVLYADCAREADAVASGGGARIPALALREKARMGALPEEVAPVLAVCLADAADAQTVRNLAKALAAFGPRARPVVRALVDKLQSTHVTDDDSFWTLDTLIYAVAFVGGDEARAAIRELASSKASPVAKSKALYRGGLKEAERSKLFQATLARAAQILDDDKPEGWREKRTDMAALPIEKQTKQKPWQSR